MTKPTTIQLKVLIYETLQTQRDFIKFLKMVGARYERLLNDAEAYEAGVLMQRASDTIDRLTNTIENATITISDEKYHNDSSDDNVPEPGQYPYYQQNPYYNPYCAPGSSYCSQYGSNPYCPVYSSQNPYCGSYYNYSPNNCVNYACTVSYPYQYATTTQQVTPQVIIQNITVTQSVTATPTPTTQVTMATSTMANTDQTTIHQDFTTIVSASILSAIVGFVIASKMAKSQAPPSQPQTFTPQATDKKVCYKCGSGISIDSVYCAACGTKVI